MYLNRICILIVEYELYVINRLMYKIYIMQWCVLNCIFKLQYIYLDRVLILYDFWGKVSLNIIKNYFNFVSKMYKFRNCLMFFLNVEISCLYIGIENIVLFCVLYYRKNDNYMIVRECWQR